MSCNYNHYSYYHWYLDPFDLDIWTEYVCKRMFRTVFKMCTFFTNCMDSIFPKICIVEPFLFSFSRLSGIRKQIKSKFNIKKTQEIHANIDLLKYDLCSKRACTQLVGKWHIVNTVLYCTGIYCDIFMLSFNVMFLCCY